MTKPYRTRSRYDGFNDGYTVPVYTIDSGGSEAYYATYSDILHTFGLFEEIYDRQNSRISNKPAKGKFDASKCNHDTIETRLSNKPYVYTQPFGPTGLEKAVPDHSPFYTTPDIVKGLTSSFPDSVWGDCSLNAWHKFREQVPESVSIANFIYELRELKDLIPEISKKHIPKSLNDSFLSFNFGWKPLIGDLQKLLSIYQSITNRLDYLRRTRGKLTKVRYMRPDAWRNPAVSTDITRYHPFSQDVAGGARFIYHLDSHSNIFSASCDLYQDLENIDDAWSVWRAAIAGLGLNNPSKIVWNAIPFSFLLDWVLPVQSWLQNFSIQPFTGRWDVSNVTSSVKSVRFYRCYQQFYFGPRQYKGWIKHTSYQRVVGLPVTLSEVDFGKLTPLQQGLFGSLILSEIFKKH